MDFSIDAWAEEIVSKLRETFQEQIIFIGLQGSYARNEATENSDIDLVVIFEELTLSRMEKYKEILSTMPFQEKACGFVSGKKELCNWEKWDLFQFCHDISPILGSLDFVEKLIQKSDAQQAVRIGACNIYHMCCHNFLFDNSVEMLVGLYKSAYFVLTAKYFCDTGIYVKTKAELAQKLTGIDKEILNICQNPKQVITPDNQHMKEYSKKLLNWCSQLLEDYQV